MLPNYGPFDISLKLHYWATVRFLRMLVAGPRVVRRAVLRSRRRWSHRRPPHLSAEPPKSHLSSSRGPVARFINHPPAHPSNSCGRPPARRVPITSLAAALASLQVTETRTHHRFRPSWPRCPSHRRFAHPPVRLVVRYSSIRKKYGHYSYERLSGKKEDEASCLEGAFERVC